MPADVVLVGARGTSSTNTVSTTPGAVSAGDALVAIVSFDPAVTITSITINGSGSDAFGAAKASLTGTSKLAAYELDNATGGLSVSVTVNFSGNAFPTVHLVKGTGVAVAAYDPASLASSAADTTTPWAIASGTPAQANNVWVVGLEQNVGSSGAYASSNFSVLSSESNTASFWTSGVAKLYDTGGVALTPSMTRSGSTNAASAMIVLGLKEAGAAPAQPPGKPWQTQGGMGVMVSM